MTAFNTSTISPFFCSFFGPQPLSLASIAHLPAGRPPLTRQDTSRPRYSSAQRACASPHRTHTVATDAHCFPSRSTWRDVSGGCIEPCTNLPPESTQDTIALATFDERPPLHSSVRVHSWLRLTAFVQPRCYARSNDRAATALGTSTGAHSRFLRISFLRHLCVSVSPRQVASVHGSGRMLRNVRLTLIVES